MQCHLKHQFLIFVDGGCCKYMNVFIYFNGIVFPRQRPILRTLQSAGRWKMHQTLKCDIVQTRRTMVIVSRILPWYFNSLTQ